MTITNQQVIRLKQMIHKYNQGIAAAKSGMSTKSARKYLSSNKTPCELKKGRHWKTRTNVFEDDWDKIESMVNKAPGLQAKTILANLDHSISILRNEVILKDTFFEKVTFRGAVATSGVNQTWWKGWTVWK